MVAVESVLSADVGLTLLAVEGRDDVSCSTSESTSQAISSSSSSCVDADGTKVSWRLQRGLCGYL